MASRGRRRARGGGGNEAHDVKLSKGLSWLLRHGAEKEGFRITSQGFVLVADILKHPKYTAYTEADIRKVVEENDKQRFALETNDNNELMIRANQGHTMAISDLELTPVDPQETPVAIHGTYEKCITSIRKQGLSRMSRQHIHMAVAEPGSSGVISGMRKSCDYLVYVDIVRASEAGLKFFRSANNVILCDGNEDGLILAKYFKKVTART